MTGIAQADLPRAEALREYLTVQRWLREKAPKTAENYLASMLRFTDVEGVNPDQFLEWAKTVDPVMVQDRIDRLAEKLQPATSFTFKIGMRSFLGHSGYTLPKAKLTYTLQDWHRGYKKEEVRKLIGYLDTPLRKLYVYIAAETGLRANTVLALRYRHVKEDLAENVIPCAIRLEPKFYGKRKSAGYTFLGERSVALLLDCIKQKLVKTTDDSPLIPLGYAGLYDALVRARHRAKLDPKIQPNHGLRKYFEDALDSTRIDRDKKMMIEGHFAGTRAKHYTDREWDELRKLYREAYPNIDVDTANAGLDKRILGLEDENSELKQRIEVLEGQVESSEKESMGKLQAAAKSMGFDLGVLAEEILRQARRRQRQSS